MVIVAPKDFIAAIAAVLWLPVLYETNFKNFKFESFTHQNL